MHKKDLQNSKLNEREQTARWTYRLHVQQK